MPVFEKNIAGFKTYGVAEVGILTDYFHQGLQAPYQEVDSLEQDLEYALVLLKLPPEKEDNFVSVSEWESSDSELSDQGNMDLHILRNTWK